MGEYAKRLSDGEEIKIGTCYSMYYLRLEDIDKVQAQPGSCDPAQDMGLRFRLPFPDEDDTQPGEYQPFERGLRLYRKSVDDWGYEVAQDYAPEWLADEKPGCLQLIHEQAGLLVNVDCHHGLKLPHVGHLANAHWNGKSYSLELAYLKRTPEGIKPVIRCRHCDKLWERDWAEVMPYVQGEIRSRLKKHAPRHLASEGAE